jgi:hypothetical protein
VTPEEQAALDSAQEKQIRELAAQITQMSKLGFDPLTVRKGIVAAVADTTTPPTVSINISGDTTTLVSQVRTLNNYTPLVGQTVLVGKQGTEIFLLGAISAASPLAPAATSDSGWTKATLTNGTHDGNSNGDVEFRRVLDHGSWKMQWRGGWSPAGATTMIDTGNALETDFRPTKLRTLLAARQTSGGQIPVQFDFHTDGRVLMVGSTLAPVTAGGGGGYGTDVRLSGYLSQAGSDLGHSHIVNNDHTHAITTTAPGWVSLNGVEYFL